MGVVLGCTTYLVYLHVIRLVSHGRRPKDHLGQASGVPGRKHLNHIPEHANMSPAEIDLFKIYCAERDRGTHLDEVFTWSWCSF